MHVIEDEWTHCKEDACLVLVHCLAALSGLNMLLNTGALPCQNALHTAAADHSTGHTLIRRNV